MSAMTSNFGGKKAAPFRKGGKPRKAVVAKAVVAKAKRAKREMALSVIAGREIDLNWAQWNEQHKGANRNSRNPRKQGTPQAKVINGVKVHTHLIKPTTFKGKPGYTTPDGNVWGSHEDAVAHMTKTAKARAAAPPKSRGHGTSSGPSKKTYTSDDGNAWKSREDALRHNSKDGKNYTAKDGSSWKSREDAKNHNRKIHKRTSAKGALSRAKMSKLDKSLSVIAGREIDLGRDGSKWRHGWIPLNPQAVALKAHHSKGGSGVSSPGEHMGKIREHVIAARREAAASSYGDYTRDTLVHQGPLGSGHVRVTHSLRGSKYTVMTSKGNTEHTSAEKAAVALHRHLYGAPKDNSEKTAWRAGTPATEASGKGPSGDRHAAIIAAHSTTAGKKAMGRGGSAFNDTPVHEGPGGKGFVRASNDGNTRTASTATYRAHSISQGSNGEELGYAGPTRNNAAVAALDLHTHIYGKGSASKPSVSSDMSPQAKIDNAEKMFGTGSPKHLEALQRFGTESQKRAAAYQIREGNPKTRTTGIGGKKVTELKPMTLSERKAKYDAARAEHGMKSPQAEKARAEHAAHVQKEYPAGAPVSFTRHTIGGSSEVNGTVVGHRAFSVDVKDSTGATHVVETHNPHHNLRKRKK